MAGEETNSGEAGLAGARERAPRAGSGAFRLEKRTYLDREQDRGRVILRDFGGGLCEVGWAFVPAARRDRLVGKNPPDRAEAEDRAARRARSRLRHLILGAHADHLLTLTYRLNVTAFAQASADLSRFVRRVRKQLSHWVYIGVPEQQRRGAWHWHLAVVGRQDVKLLRACWRAVVCEGNIDVQARKLRNVHPRLALIRYLSKYLMKGFKDGTRELNGHRFRASLGIIVPAERVPVPAEARTDLSAFALQALRARAGSVGFAWTADDGVAGWACSWK